MNTINQLLQLLGVLTVSPHLSSLDFSFPILPRANKLLLLFGIVFLSMNNRLSAFTEETYSDATERLWPLIETQLDQPNPDTSIHFIFLLVRGHCGQNYNCLYPTYAVVMEKLERLFNLPAAIQVGNEMAKIAHLEKDFDSEGNAYMQLFRFYGALGDERLAVVSMEKAAGLYAMANNQEALNKIRILKLETSLCSRDIREVLPELEATLEEVEAMGDTANANSLNLRLINYTKWMGDYKLMEKHVSAAEATVVPAPFTLEDYYFAIHTKLGRADLERIKNNLAEAEQVYKKALQLSIEMPDPWLEVKTLQSLTELEWERGDIHSAKSYLNTAQEKAEKLKSEDLLTYNFELQAKIAETEKRYADALGFIKKKQVHEENFRSKSEGFNTENFYLQKDKKQLAAEKEKQEMELRFKDAQLRNLVIIIALGLLLIAALVLAFINQRKARQKLANQNALILQQAEVLKNLDAAKSRFFANVSHELRNPLSLVLGPISTLIKENKLNERHAKLLQMVSASGRQLEQLVSEILDLGKLEMGKMGVDEKPTIVWTLFQKHLLQFESLAYQKNIDFSYELNLDKGLVANIDQAKYRQILCNLLSNAFKFTPAGGQVKANLSIKNNRLQLVVADTGKGIHTKDLPFLFDRYFQTHQSDSPATGGTGIGLALCHEYAQLFDGKITVDSKIGEGSVFRFESPVVIVESQQPAISVQPLIAPPTSPMEAKTTHFVNNKRGNKPTILVVDDNLELQRYIRLVLEDSHNVITADNGQVALQKIMANDKVDLILSDLMMPVMDGYQLLEKLKSDDATRHIPVIMLTARAEAKDKLKALRLGVDDYLVKPFEEEEVLVQIENLLKNAKVRQATVLVEKAEADLQPAFSERENTTQLALAAQQRCPNPVVSAADSEWLAQLEENLQNELAKFDFKLEQLAELMLVSRRQLGRQVKALTGLTPSEYLLEVRLQQARQLLMENNVKTVKEATYTVGIRDTKHFSKQFRQRFGKSPSAYLSPQPAYQ